MKVSKIETRIRQRTGYPGIINYADIVIDGESLYEMIAHKYDFVSSLGWGSNEFQEQQIDRLLLRMEAELPDNRNTLYICPACADLGCGAITIEINFVDEVVTWSKFGWQNNLEDNNKVSYLENINEYTFNRKDYEEVIEATKGIGMNKWPWDKEE